MASVACSGAHTAAIDKNGGLWVWGKNHTGVFGNGSGMEQSLVPVKVMDNAKAVTTAYRAAGSRMAVIDRDNNLWMSGSNGNGQAGVDASTFPVLNVLTMVRKNVAAVALDYDMTAVVDTDGSLWLFGNNQGKGVFGKGTTGMDTVGKTLGPVKLMDNIATVALNDTVCAAVDKQGGLWTWGSDEYGCLGINNRSFSPFAVREEPVKIMDNVQSVSLTDMGAAAVDKNGGLWVWGNSDAGRLANARELAVNLDATDGVSDYVWKAVKILDNISCVSVANHCMAVTTQGDLLTWGFDSVGQLGSGGAVSFIQGRGDNCSLVPTQVMQGVALPTAAVQPAAPAQTEQIMAPYTDAAVYVGWGNRTPTTFEAYRINNNNYFKLRDIAQVLRGTRAEFEVTWDAQKGAVCLFSHTPYTSVGGEMTPGDNVSKLARSADSVIYKDGQPILLQAYVIDGNNYFKLRDLGIVFGFNVSWDNELEGITIDPNSAYTSD